MGRKGQKVAKSIKTSCNFHLNCNFWGYIWSTEKEEYVLESVGPMQGKYIHASSLPR